MSAEVSWGRLAADLGSLERIGRRVKQLLGRTVSVADPAAAGSRDPATSQERRGAGGRRPLVSTVWIGLVAAANARQLRRAAAPCRRGATVVCDRSAVDSLVDFRLRYGRHRVAEALLTRLAPEPDVGIWLRVDAEAAASRGDGDYGVEMLRRMEHRYAEVAPRHGYREVDATPSREEVRAHLDGLVSAAVLGPN